MEEQRRVYNRGDYVRVNADLGECKSHFTKDCNAIVVGSYADQYGGNNIHSYTLFLEGGGETSWYYDCDFKLVEANRVDLLDEWKRQEKDEDELKSNLDWIFCNGNEVLEDQHHAAIKSLGKSFGIDNMWGRHGEGIVYCANRSGVLAVAKPFLIAGDRTGWEEFCEKEITRRSEDG